MKQAFLFDVEKLGKKERPCRGCGEDDISRFSKDPTCHQGLRSRCKSCLGRSNAEWRLKNKDKVREYNKERNLKNKDEIRKKDKEWKLKNRDKIIARRRQLRAENIDYVIARERKWRDDNRDRYNEKLKRWKDENQDLLNSYRAKRKAIKKRAIPIDGYGEEMGLIKGIYLDCINTSEQTGIKHEVDHIVPLQGALPDGKRVLGAHRVDNLQVITERENRSKGNRITYEELAKYKEGHHYIFVPDDYFDDVDKYPDIGF